jgi:hypothetical protein
VESNLSLFISFCHSGVVSAKDEDAGQIVTLEVAQGQEFVTLRRNKLFTAKTFNFEEMPKFAINILANDDGNPSLSVS